MSDQNDEMSDGCEMLTATSDPVVLYQALCAATDEIEQLMRERDEAQKGLSSIHRWIERNHADGFIDSLTYSQNLERVTDNWYDRIDAIEKDSKRFVRERDEAREAIKNFYKAKGRHNSQIAAARMFELVGLPAEYPQAKAPK